MRILIVEDDLMLGKLIRIALENQRYIVDWVIDDSEFFSAIKSTHYEIIILDINLPDKSGIEILQIMCSMKNHSPVLILTALNSAMQKVNGLDAGADDYLTKPFDLKFTFTIFVKKLVLILLKQFAQLAIKLYEKKSFT